MTAFTQTFYVIRQLIREVNALIESIKGSIFSLNGTALFVAVIGVLSSVVTIFVDTDTEISVRWLLFSVTVGAYAVVILLKVCYDALEKGRPLPPFETPIRFVPDGQIFVIRKNENFLSNILVGCYSQVEGLDRLAYVGVVEHIQSNLIQVKIQVDLNVMKSIPITAEELKMLEIRPVVPFTVLQQLARLEN